MLALLFLASFIQGQTNQAERSTLGGIVQNDKGQPVPGALVRIYYAGPRKGTGDLCPSCYPDCGKKAVTDEQGKFALRDLDSKMIFVLLVAAKDHAALLTGGIDPAKGEAKLGLKSHELDRRDPELIFRGRVVDFGGKPVENALVKPSGVVMREEGSYEYVSEIADRLAITDRHGEFRVGLTKKIKALYMTVEAPFLAPKQTGPLPWGPKINDEIKLVAGVTVEGKVVKDGQPLAGVTLALNQNMIHDLDLKRDRVGAGASSFGLTFRIDTDAKGRFRFLSIPPDEEFVFFGTMDSFRTHGALKTRKVIVKEDGSTLELGTLSVERGYQLSGRIILSDGKPAPEGKRVWVYRREEAAYDVQRGFIGKDGVFAFEGVPPELVQLDASFEGYKVSIKNYSADIYHGHGLWGMANKDMIGIRFLFEPGKFAGIKSGEDSDRSREYWRRRETTLQGAPAE